MEVLMAIDYGDSFMTVKQVSQLLNVSNQTVRNWIKIGILPAKRINARVFRIEPDDVKKLLTERR
jgi:excisionase family DNA binding protein